MIRRFQRSHAVVDFRQQLFEKHQSPHTICCQGIVVLVVKQFGQLLVALVHALPDAMMQLLKLPILLCFPRFRDRFAPFHLLHQEFGGHRRIAFRVRAPAGQFKQILSASQRTLQSLIRLVDARRPL